MNTVTRITLVDPDPITRPTLARMLVGVPNILLAAVHDDYDPSRHGPAPQEPGSLTLVAVDADQDRALELIRALKRQDPGAVLVPASHRLDVEAVLRFVRAGAPDYLHLPATPADLLALIDRLPNGPAAAPPPAGGRRDGRVVAVAGASGGVGCTSVAVNLAAQLARGRAASVALLDLDLLFGSVAAWLNVNPVRDLVDVLGTADRLDPELLLRSMSEHAATGLHVLPGPRELEDVGRVEPEAVRRLIDQIVLCFEFAVIDTSKALQVTDMIALERADLVLLVVQSDLIHLYHSARMLALFRRMDGLDERVSIVLNRVGSDAGSISTRKVEDTLGRPVLCQIPNTFRAFHDARTHGRPLDYRGAARRVCPAFEELARLVRARIDPLGAQPSAPEVAGRLGRLWSSLVGPGDGGPCHPARA